MQLINRAIDNHITVLASDQATNELNICLDGNGSGHGQVIGEKNTQLTVLAWQDNRDHEKKKRTTYLPLVLALYGLSQTCMSHNYLISSWWLC